VPLYSVLQERAANGALIASYVHGLGLIERIDAAGVSRVYHYDRSGNTLALTDASGAITDLYAYDPFGVILDESGATPNPFDFSGAYGVMNERDGLHYARARFLDVGTGRFVGKDPIAGVATHGSTLNRFSYATNNPITKSDASGLSPTEIISAGRSQFESSDANHALLVEIDQLQRRFLEGIATIVLEKFVSDAHNFKLVHDSRGFWRRAPRVGNAGQLADFLDFAGDALVLYDVVKTGVGEFQDRGYSTADLSSSISDLGGTLGYAFGNPDQLIRSTLEGTTSATAVTLDVLSLHLFDIDGTDVEAWANNAAEWLVRDW